MDSTVISEHLWFVLGLKWAAVTEVSSCYWAWASSACENDPWARRHISLLQVRTCCICPVRYSFWSWLVRKEVRNYDHVWGINPSYWTYWGKSKPSWKSSSHVPNHWIVLGVSLLPFMNLYFLASLKFRRIPVILPVLWKELSQGQALGCQFLGKRVCTSSRWFWIASFPNRFSFCVSKCSFWAAFEYV